ATWLAFHGDPAAEQASELAADREAQAGASVLVARGTVGLLEGLEDHGKLVARYASAGVLHRECNQVFGIAKRLAWGFGTLDAQLDMTLRRELDRIGEQIAKNLLEPLLVGMDLARRVLGDVDFEGEPAIDGNRAERGVHVVEQFDQRQFLRPQVQPSGLDL